MSGEFDFNGFGGGLEADITHLERLALLDANRAALLNAAGILFFEPTRENSDYFEELSDAWFGELQNYIHFIMTNAADLPTELTTSELFAQQYLREDKNLNEIFAKITDDNDTFFVQSNTVEDVAERVELAICDGMDEFEVMSQEAQTLMEDVSNFARIALRFSEFDLAMPDNENMINTINEAVKQALLEKEEKPTLKKRACEFAGKIMVIAAGVYIGEKLKIWF